MKPLFIALLPIVLFLYFRTTATANEYGTLTGRITDTSGKPISWAAVWLATEHRGTMCMDNGMFSILNLSPGNYCATILHEKYETVTIPFTIVADSTTDIKVSLTPQPVLPNTASIRYGTLQGVLTDTNGDPIRGAGVRIMGYERGAYSKDNGAYRVTKLKPGRYIVQVTAVSFERVQQEVIITAEETTNLSLSLAQDDNVITYEPLRCDVNELQINHSQIGTIRVIPGNQLWHSP